LQDEGPTGKTSFCNTTLFGEQVDISVELKFDTYSPPHVGYVTRNKHRITQMLQIQLDIGLVWAVKQQKYESAALVATSKPSVELQCKIKIYCFGTKTTKTSAFDQVSAFHHTRCDYLQAKD